MKSGSWTRHAPPRADPPRPRNNHTVVLFSVYAVIVWYAAARYRRTWIALAAVAAGVAGLILVALFHIQLARWSHGRIFLPTLQLMLYPYILLVAAIGLYLSLLPRIIPVTACRTCEYDLRGLAAVVCPECGRRPLPDQAAAIATGSPPPAISPATGATRDPRPASGLAIPGWSAIAAPPAFRDPSPE